MSFYPIRIAQTPGFGFTGGPEFSTNVQNIANGREKRNADWAICRHKYTAPFRNIPEAAYRAIKDVFLVTRGKAHTFLHRDWGDYVATNAAFGTGDGTTTVFQLGKTSTAGSGTYYRTIDKPNSATPLAVPFVVKVAGAVTGVVVDSTTGIVTFATAPAMGAALTWSGEFDVHVRFDIDYLPFSLDDRNTNGYVTNGSVDLMEVVGE
ncbi:MAG TPA: DUF2460 domain-containing protein [Telluria sp.]|nr:DUF2460 domain-containing protein [Telluria sp.]